MGNSKTTGLLLFETDRLAVRQFNAADADLFFAVNGDPLVMAYIRPAKSRAESDRFLQENLALYQPGSLLGRYAVFGKYSHNFAGTFSFLPLGGGDEYHLGYALLPACWGQGFATELAVAGTAYFFQHTDKKALFAVAQAENLASGRVLQKSGYRLSGKMQEEGKLLNIYCCRLPLKTKSVTY